LAVTNIDQCRDVVLLLQSFARAVSNTMLVYSDEAFTMSLIFYNMVREMSRRGDPTATVLFNTLRPFFRRRTATTAEPTAKQLEKDIHGLLHGTKDAEIIGKLEESVDEGRGSRETAEANQYLLTMIAMQIKGVDKGLLIRRGMGGIIKAG
jgi:hypothetical protein